MNGTRHKAARASTGMPTGMPAGMSPGTSTGMPGGMSNRNAIVRRVWAVVPWGGSGPRAAGRAEREMMGHDYGNV